MRFFYGLELPDSVRAALTGLSSSLPGKIALPEQLHLTLAFVGELPPAKIGPLSTILDRAARKFPPCRLTLGEAGLFDDGTLYAGVACDDTLSAIAADIRDMLSENLLPFDGKPFVPHITLARKSALTDVALPALSWTADTLTLFESLEAGSKRIYHPLARATL